MNTPTIKSSDLYVLTQCDRQVYLNYNGDPDQRGEMSRYQAWLVKRGVDFESQVVSTFHVSQPTIPAEDLDAGAALTLDLMREGVDLIYQGVLKIGDMVGIPDLMERVPGASKLGDHYYRPMDIKGSSKSQSGHRLQVMAYIALLESIQGVRPDGGLLLHIPVQDRDTEQQMFHQEHVEFDPALYGAERAHVVRLAGGDEPRPFISSTCDMCAWQEVCRPIAEAAHDVSLISGLKRIVWEALHAQDLGTLEALANAQPDQLVLLKGVGEKTAVAMIHHARALVRETHIPLKPPPRMPTAPAIFFDIESVPSEDLYYLMGMLIRTDGNTRFSYDLAEAHEDEPRMWASFLTRIEAASGPVYHYGYYERTSVKKLAERYGDEARTNRLLDRMIDLEKLLKESAALPLPGYSLKQVAPWLGFSWNTDTHAGDDSMLEYLAWLEDGERSHLDGILAYNEADCRATAVVLDWLITLR